MTQGSNPIQKRFAPLVARHGGGGAQGKEQETAADEMQSAFDDLAAVRRRAASATQRLAQVYERPLPSSTEADHVLEVWLLDRTKRREQDAEAFRLRMDVERRVERQTRQRRDIATVATGIITLGSAAAFAGGVLSGSLEIRDLAEFLRPLGF